MGRGRSAWRLRSSFISSIISTMLVLYTVGMLAFLLIDVRRLSDFVKENLSISIVLPQDVKTVDAEFLRRTLDASAYTKSTDYISKDQAARELSQSLGQDFLQLLNYNPLSPSIELKLRAAWANRDSIQKISKALQKTPQVMDVIYQVDLVDLVNENVQRISVALLAFSLLMSFIALVLINNTVRISVYAKRFIIRTMQLVGATSSFTRRPFLLRAARHGLLSGLLAILLLLQTIWLVSQEFPELVNLEQYPTIIAVSLIVLAVGVLINVLATYFAVNKYLRLATDDLYY